MKHLWTCEKPIHLHWSVSVRRYSIMGSNQILWVANDCGIAKITWKRSNTWKSRRSLHQATWDRMSRQEFYGRTETFYILEFNAGFESYVWIFFSYTITHFPAYISSFIQYYTPIKRCLTYINIYANILNFQTLINFPGQDFATKVHRCWEGEARPLAPKWTPLGSVVPLHQF